MVRPVPSADISPRMTRQGQGKYLPGEAASNANLIVAEADEQNGQVAMKAAEIGDK